MSGVQCLCHDGKHKCGVSQCRSCFKLNIPDPPLCAQCRREHPVTLIPTEAALSSPLDAVVKQTSFTQPKLQAMSILKLIEAEKPLTLTSEQAALLEQVLCGYISALDYFQAVLKG